MDSTSWLVASLLSGTPKDEELLERLKKRNPEALSDLYDRYGPVVFSLLQSFVHDRATAEDLCQEVFMTIWRRAADFNPNRGTVGAWLMTTARNRAYDYLRWNRYRTAPKNLDLEKFETPDRLADLERDLIDRDRVVALQEALKRLDARQREVINLAFFEGLSQSEMAERLHQPLGTVKTWVRGALRNLRQELQQAAHA